MKCSTNGMETVIINPLRKEPFRKEFKLVHYKQQHEWDCGISCVLMILQNEDRDYFVKNFHKICIEEGFGYSTWTIDLCYLLKKFTIKHFYFTKTIGVDPKYKEHNYYKNIVVKDEVRVNKRFHEAEMNGIKLDKKTVKFNDFLRHLSTHGPIILLTNSSLLHCDICTNKKELEEVKNLSYVGHYVILVGYDYGKHKIFYRNPAKEDHACVTSTVFMDKARTAFGTDEDVIFIFL